MAQGGKREGAGRPLGSLGKATAEIKALAGKYGPDAILKLAQMAGLTDEEPAESEQTRLGAIKELLDRGYGKSTQPIAGDAEHGPIHMTFGWMESPAASAIVADATTTEGEE